MERELLSTSPHLCKLVGYRNDIVMYKYIKERKKERKSLDMKGIICNGRTTNEKENEYSTIVLESTGSF